MKTIELLKEALETKLLNNPEGEISLLMSHYAAKCLLDELTDILNREDDGK